MVLGGRMWKSQRKWLFLPLVLSLWLSTGSTSQAEEMYQMSESELTRLEANLNQLAKNSETKQNLLNKQKIQIEMLNSQLEKANKSAGRTEERNTEIQGIERSDAEVIRESQSILGRIRARGKKES